ncbi:MAG: TldD/PmbA family protein [Gemmatimonadetes bacterium]|nr:TldD/PmbA family protein [Gemmatimonadota bacterium]MDA1103410.1 TldD/PmbA family protein [Gemmatimonadota bacterium]
MKRREFVRHSAVGAAGMGLVGNADLLHGILVPSTLGRGISQDRDALAAAALNAARTAGADYADIRIATNRTQRASTRERIVSGVMDSETSGFGIRVLVDGTWGFAASRDVSLDEVARVARVAVAQGRANRAAQRRPVELAPLDWTGRGEWRSPIEIDPFTVPIEDKVALLLQANEAAMAVAGVAFANSNMAFLREEKFFASTDGVITDQTIYRAAGGVSVTAVAPDRSDFQSRSSNEIAPRGLGYEHILNSDLVGGATRWAEEAVQKLSAKPVQPGRYDLVLRPSHLWLTIHEAIAHPTELDRIMGFEANYAGTSFISSPEAFLGSFRYGPEIMNIQGERTTPTALSTVGWDDEGVQPDEYLIVKDGVLNDLQTTREQAPWLSEWYASQGRGVRSHGNSYGQSWDVTQFQRMPNVNLLPHPDRDVSEAELIDGVENGILIDGDGSFSIDQQRYNAQFGGQTFYEIKNGQVTGMLKDVAYQIRTPEFWNGMDLIGGPSTYELGGSFGDAKGQPAQSNAITHGCPTTRHRDITIINTGRRA